VDVTAERGPRSYAQAVRLTEGTNRPLLRGQLDVVGPCRQLTADIAGACITYDATEAKPGSDLARKM